MTEDLGAAAARLLARLEERAKQRGKDQKNAPRLPLETGSANEGDAGGKDCTPLLRRHRFKGAANDNARLVTADKSCAPGTREGNNVPSALAAAWAWGG